MKGLLYKESRCLWQYGKSYILMVVIFFDRKGVRRRREDG